MEREEVGGGRGCIGKAPEDAMRTLYHLGCRLRIPRPVCCPVCSRGQQDREARRGDQKWGSLRES